MGVARIECLDSIIRGNGQILVAEHVYEDKKSGKKIVAGIFRNLQVIKTTQKKWSMTTGQLGR